jgi:hypothetical protein
VASEVAGVPVGGGGGGGGGTGTGAASRRWVLSLVSSLAMNPSMDAVRVVSMDDANILARTCRPSVPAPIIGCDGGAPP